MDVRCELCPKECVIPPGHSGDCRVRVNQGGTLRAVTYGFPVSAHVDPIEKKPLYHVTPGASILSVATVGCNLHCLNCQNWQISQANPEESEAYDLPPHELVATARRVNSALIAYTYTEPLVFYEYTLESARRARAAGLKNVLVTAGYAKRAPLERLFAVTDAANVDLKALSDRFYREVCDARLGPVLDALVLARAMGVWLEVTNLIIPTLNDDPKMIRALTRWIARNLGRETPLHLSAFRPHHKMRHLPATPYQALLTAREIAREEGLHHVYVGNLRVEGGGETRCAGCGQLVIARRGYRILKNVLEDGACPACGEAVQGVWR